MAFAAASRACGCWLFALGLQAANVYGAPAPNKITDRVQAGMVRVVPDSYGTISEIVLQYDPSAASMLERTYRDFFSSLPQDVRIKVLCPNAMAADDFELAWQEQFDERDVRIINVGIPISIWARDRVIFRQDASLRGRAASFVPVAYPYYEETKVNDLIALDMLGDVRLIPGVLSTVMHIEGGNVVSNSRHVFVGANMFDENETIPRDRLLASARQVLGRGLLAVGEKSGIVPWCHVDMYLTPIDDHTILVASPRMAEMIMGTNWEASENEETADEWNTGTCLSETVQQQFDDVATSLEEEGYRVIRLPALIGPTDDYMVTYNNVIMDRRDGRRVVYMPVYDMPHLDFVADAIYRGLGFEVRSVNVADMYARGGAIRCLFNVSERRMDDSTCDSAVPTLRPRIFHLAMLRKYDRMLERSSRRVAQQGCYSPGTPDPAVR